MVGANHEVEIPAFVVWAVNTARVTVNFIECGFLPNLGGTAKLEPFRPNYWDEKALYLFFRRDLSC